MAHRANTPRLLVPFVGALLCAAPASALDPGKAIGQYVYDSWGTRHGLPVGDILAIAQTSDGYLWLGSGEGLVRFDGARFTVFDRRNTKELPHVRVTAVAASRDGSLWVGTPGGVTRYKDGVVTAPTWPDDLAKPSVECLYEDRRGTLWVGTGTGLHEWRDRRVRTYTTRDGLPHDYVRTIHEDRAGDLWIGTRAGLGRLHAGRFETFTLGVAGGNSVLALYADHNGVLWAGTFSGLKRIQDGRVTTYTTAQGLSHDTVNSLAEDAQGNLWIGTYGGGVNRLRGGGFSSFKREDGLSDDLVVALHLDAEGSLWIGTALSGVARLKDGPITAVTTKEGLGGDVVRVVYQDDAGAIWIGTHGGGLSRLAGDRVTTYRAGRGLESDIVFSVLGDGVGGLWVGTYAAGLHRFRDGRLTRLRSPELPANQHVLSLLRDRQGTLWLGTYAAGGGLKRLRNSGLETVRTEPPVMDVWALLEDAGDGALWLGTATGLCRLRGSAFRCFKRRDGLPGDSVQCLHQDAEGALWMCASGALARYRDGRFSFWTTEDGLFDDNLHAILEDDQGYLWMSCNHGIFRVLKRELEERAAGTRQRVTSIAYGVADGMKSAECNGGTQPAAWRARDGRLWFATAQGAVVVDPARLPKTPPAPPALIEELVVDGRALPWRPGPDLEPGARRFEFRYTAPYLADASRLRFRYRIDDVDDEWVEAGAQRVAHYTNLPPGRHRFRVISGNGEGTWTDPADALDFRLRPYFYQTAWFYALCALGAGLLGYAGHRYRVRRLLEVERVRTRIAGDLHDDIGASLTQIAILSELVRRRMNEPDATESLDRIGRLSRESVDAMGDIVWAIDPQKDRLQHLTRRLRGLAVEVLSTAGIEHRFAGDEYGGGLSLGPDVRREVFLVFKESLNNVVRHSGARTVDIGLAREGGRLVLRVHDDGRGFDPAGAAGNGLRSMRRRAAAVGGALDVSSGTTGTTVTLSVPI